MNLLKVFDERRQRVAMFQLDQDGRVSRRYLSTYFINIQGLYCENSDGTFACVQIDENGNFFGNWDLEKIYRPWFAGSRRSSQSNYQVIQINRFQPIDNGRVQLTGAIKWRKEYTKTLLDQNRFALCSHAAFIMEEGSAYYAFINADEKLTSSVDPTRTWIPTQNGAFLYLFNKDASPDDRDCFHELPSFILGAQVSDEN